MEYKTKISSKKFRLEERNKDNKINQVLTTNKDLNLVTWGIKIYLSKQ